MGKVIDFYTNVVLDPKTGKAVALTRKNIRRLINQMKADKMRAMSKLQTPPIS